MRARSVASLSVSVAKGRPDFKPDWEKVEKAYGTVLNANMRAEIIAIVDHYLHRERFEAAAPPLDKTLNWVRRAKRESLALSRTLWGGISDELVRAGREHVLDSVHSIAQKTPELAGIMERLPIELTWLRRRMHEQAAELEANRHIGFVEGAAWKKMILKLTNFAEAHELPLRVANRSNAKNPQPSPFVKFVWSLQNYMDGRGRHQHSCAALASAINKERRTAGRKLREGKK